MATILIMAGGTGGHIFPALAVARALTARGWRVHWLGNPDGMEAQLVPAHGYVLEPLHFAALRGKGLMRKLLLPLALLRAFAAALRVLRRVRPDVVLGMGGYVSFPGAMMAVLLGRPLVLHEQNSVAGLANRVAARVADRIYAGFPDVLPGAQWVGNPVRDSIAALAEPEQRLAGRDGPLRVLVLGGSLGAQALNVVLPEALALMPDGDRPLIRHQTGRDKCASVAAEYRRAGVAAEVLPFIDDMATAYADADLVIARAGALTIAELCAAGVASVLVPYPFAVDRHQHRNAAFLVEREAALMIDQDELSAPALAELLRSFGRTRLTAMAAAARALARPDAADVVADGCAALAGGTP